MKAFYEHLNEGEEKSKALQHARMAYLEAASNDKSHPHFWANFVVIGEDDPIEVKSYWAWILIGLLLISGTLLLARKKIK